MRSHAADHTCLASGIAQAGAVAQVCTLRLAIAPGACFSVSQCMQAPVQAPLTPLELHSRRRDAQVGCRMRQNVCYFSWPEA